MFYIKYYDAQVIVHDGVDVPYVVVHGVPYVKVHDVLRVLLHDVLLVFLHDDVLVRDDKFPLAVIFLINYYKIMKI